MVFLIGVYLGRVWFLYVCVGVVFCVVSGVVVLVLDVDGFDVLFCVCGWYCV